MPPPSKLPWDFPVSQDLNIEYFSTSSELVIAVLHQQLCKFGHFVLQTIVALPPVCILKRMNSNFL